MSNPKHRIEKLRIKRGDVLVVRDYNTAKRLEGIHFNLQFQVPIVFAPLGIEKLSVDALKNIIAEVDEAKRIILPGVGI